MHGRVGLGERGHHRLLVGALALKACLVFGRQIHGARRHLELLLGVALGGNAVAHRARTAVWQAHRDVRSAGLGRQGNAHHGGPFPRIALHQ